MTAWESWQSTFATASGPLPDVRARAGRESRRHRRTKVSVALLLAAFALASIPAFTAPEAPVHVIGFGILGFCAAMGIGFAVIQRGDGVPGASPARARRPRFLERRLEAELRVAHLARWVYLALCLAGRDRHAGALRRARICRSPFG